MSFIWKMSKYSLLFGMLIMLVVMTLNPLPSPTVRAQDPSVPKIESDDPAVMRTGTWSNQPAAQASGGSYLYNAPSPINGDDVALSLQFSGPSIEILYVSGPNLGTMALEIDGVVLRTVITTAPQTAYQQSSTIDYLTDEAHTLRVYAQAGGVIGVDAFITPEKKSHVVDPLPVESVRSTPPCNEPSYIRRVSESPTGEEAGPYYNSSLTYNPTFSSDGRYLHFASDAQNLLPGPLLPYTWQRYAYRMDVQTCTFELVSAYPDGTPSHLSAGEAEAISRDFRYFAFSSDDPLLPNDTNNRKDIYLRDMDTNTYWNVTLGIPGNSDMLWIRAVQGLGNLVLITSTSTELVPEDTTSDPDYYLFDPATNQYELISSPGIDQEPLRYDYFPGDISDDGRYVVFGYDNLYLRDRLLQTTIQITHPWDGGLQTGRQITDLAVFSNDSQYIAYNSGYCNLVENTPDCGTTDTVGVFIYDRLTDTNSLAVPFRFPSYRSNVQSREMFRFSGDLRYLVFRYDDASLIPGDTNGYADIGLYDRQTGLIQQISVSASGDQSNGDSLHPGVSDDGRWVAFASWATNLVSVTQQIAYQPDLMMVDRSAPTVHSILEAQVGADRNVHLTLIPRSTNPTAYEITRSLNGQTNWSVIGTIPEGQLTTLDSDIICGTTYFYRARVLTIDPQYLELTNIARVQTAACPILLQHTALVASILGIGQVDLTWTQFSPTLTEFEVQRSTDGSNWISLDTAPIGQTTYTDSSVACGATYSYRLRVLTIDPDYRTFSNSQSVTTPSCTTDTLALINPDTRQMSLIDTLAIQPPQTAYTTYTLNARASGQWVMGDWDGDGVRTPGVYEASGAFMYTNTLGPTATWTGIWFGFFGKPPIAGRFDASVNHDCLGVMDSGEFPPYGTGYAAYFACDLTSGTMPHLYVQWLGVPYFSDTATHGAIQVVAGDFDGDGVDSFGWRRDSSLIYTNQPPSSLVQGYTNSTGFSTPLLPANDYGLLVLGDWNDDGHDEIGFLSQTGEFAYQSDGPWSTPVFLQHAGTPIGTPVQAFSWR